MKLSEFSDTAQESPPIAHEIAALEQQIQYHKERLKSRSYALEYKARRQLTSPAFLLAAAGAGFLGERMMRRRASNNSAHVQEQSAGKLQARESAMAQMIKAATMIQALLASYPVVTLTKMLAQQKAANTGASHEPSNPSYH